MRTSGSEAPTTDIPAHFAQHGRIEYVQFVLNSLRWLTTPRSPLRVMLLWSASLAALACDRSVTDGTPHVWSSINAATASCGLYHSRAYCWGPEGEGFLGDGIDTLPAGAAPLPKPISGNLPFTSLAAAYVDHGCGVAGGTAYCWGRNDYGELGDGTSSTRAVPTPVVGSFRFSSITVGDLHSCGLTTTGQAYCWGLDQYGELGDYPGTAFSDSVPQPVYGTGRYTSISGGEAYTCAVDVAGKGWCWGENGSGELGDTLYFHVNFPVAVAGNLTFTAINAGSNHTCGVTTSGEAYCWGLGTSGEVGNYSLDSFLTPQKVATSFRFKSVSPGVRFTCGLTTDGAAVCWGLGYSGQLGNAVTGYSRTPIPVSTDLRFTSLSVGLFHVCGVILDGAEYCWGANSEGELGDGSFQFSFSPVQVQSPSP